MKNKGDREAQLAFQAWYAANRLDRLVMASQEDLTVNNWRGTVANERGRPCFIVRLMPPRRESQRWLVRCDGLSLVLSRECRNEAHARTVFESINDFTTLRTLRRHRGFRYDW